MQIVYALRRCLPQLWLGACTLVASALFLGSGCTSCFEKPSKAKLSDRAEQSVCIEHELPAAEFGRLIKTQCKSTEEKPAIQALYVDQSFPRELLLTDILSGDSSLNQCAPGPFLFSNDNEIDVESKRWQLPSMPKYFILQLKESTGDENFYISSQNGFPINCQSFKLKQQDITTLVLMPKSKLEANKSYYLYLIQKQGESRHVWIQPLSLLVDNKIKDIKAEFEHVD